VVLGRLHPHLFNRKRPVNFTLSSRNRLRPRHRLAGCLMERVEVDGPFPYVSPQALNDCVIDVSMRGHQNESLTRLIAGWLRFFTLTQSGDRPARYGRSRASISGLRARTCRLELLVPILGLASTLSPRSTTTCWRCDSQRRHIGGAMPSRPTLTRLVSNEPSDSFFLSPAR
jgi:hypothetical protein